MIELKANEFSGRVLERVSSAAVGERVVIRQENGEPALEFERCAPTSPWKGFTREKLREVLRRHGIEPDPPDIIAAWEADFQDPVFSREVLGLKDEE